MDEQRLIRLLDKLDLLADRVEPLLPKTGSTDWTAIAHRWKPPGHYEPIRKPQQVQLDELLHIDRQKDALARNTLKFLKGRPANHALLWGSRGTGKSSLIKALLTQFSPQGLRLIEVEPSDLIHLTEIVSPLRKRQRKYLIFCDDLSFEGDDPSYKALKATLDGSVSAAPDNVLIYATSNRRHLLPEYMSENQQSRVIDGELHHGEAIEEKISLSERFGLWLSFYPFSQEQYLEVVYSWLIKLKIPVGSASEMEKSALQYALSRGSRSGRVARQFANEWAEL
ncbi:MAG: ATP-binding protein [bacterium]